jgi:hypothetical protein
MAIYTRIGSEIELLTARLVPVWIERLQGGIKWHYSEMKPSKRTKQITMMPCWHVTAKYVEDGEAVCDGKWLNANTLKADDGMGEILKVIWILNPIDQQRFEDWMTNRTEAGSFDKIEEKMVA